MREHRHLAGKARLVGLLLASLMTIRCLAAPQTYFEELHPSVAEQVSVLHQNQVSQLGDLLHWKTQLSKVMIGETSGSSDRTCFFVEWKKYENMRIKAGLAETQCDLENMVAEECCGIETPEQKQWWTGNKLLHCRIAGEDFKWVYAPNASKPNDYVEVEARAGDLVFFGSPIDSTFAPALLRPSCYQGIGCPTDEFCLINVEVPQNPWSAGNAEYNGQTPVMDVCQNPVYFERAAADEAFGESYKLFCGDMPPVAELQLAEYAYNPRNDEPITSKCVKYKKENEPCLPQLDYGPDFGPVFEYGADRLEYKVYTQGFVCLPGLKCSSESARLPHSCIPESANESTHFDTETVVLRKEWESCEGDSGSEEDFMYVCESGLVCTPGDLHVLPKTCVKPRPKDICYLNSWWNSNDCPRTSEQSAQPGLTWNQSLDAMAKFMSLFPGELSTPGKGNFWCPDQYSQTPNLKLMLEESQDILYNILEALFPMDLFPEETFPAKEELLLRLLGGNDDFFVITQNCSKNVEAILNSNDLEGEQLSVILSYAFHYSQQPNWIWSLLHFMTFNLPENISPRQVTASQATSTLLSQQFWCTDCRALYTELLETVKGPPYTQTGQAQAHWWYLAHNMAAEHVASTTGGHPLTYNINDQQIIPGTSGKYSGKEVRSIQNNFFMPYEDAQAMWRVQTYDPEKEQNTD